MGALDKIQLANDKVQAKLEAKGLREYTIDLITPAYNDPLLGVAGAGLPTPIRLTPAVVVEEVSERHLAVPGGVLKVGDLRVSKISRSAEFSALILDPKTVWRVAGPVNGGDYSTVGGSVKRRNGSWEVGLRKRVQ